MSFDIVCPNCGAPSSASVGTCPYCKAVFQNKKQKSKETPLLGRLKKEYKEGHLDKVLFDCDLLFRSKEKMQSNANFLLLYVKVLLETEGPASKIRSLLSRVLLADPENEEAMIYLDILEAKEELTDSLNDPGEQKLKRIIKRAPKNAYAHFLLGSHMFWVDKQDATALKYLEKAVKLHPRFIRAWGCLGAIYRSLGNDTLSKRAFSHAAKLESNPRIKKFFKNY
jgi:tetratricopeptide (TPR) repeat protein